jgi:hypothetical protein
MSFGIAGSYIRKPTRRCSRCGLKHPKEDEHCIHCFHLKSDVELKKFKEAIKNEMNSSSKVGFIFLFIALGLSGLLALLST